VKLTIALTVLLSGASVAPAQAVNSNANVRHVIGLDTIKRNATGSLTVESNELRFNAGKTAAKVPVSSIEDIFIGTETTQSGGKTGRVVKTAAIAAPYESGKALTILLRTKVDILTVEFRDTGGALHGAIFALPKGQAEQMRTQLTQAGAHVSASPEKLVERDPKEAGKP
jgi:predicted RecA/RadA family phage recombinase